MSDTPQAPSTRDHLFMIAAAIPFLASMLVLGLALSNGVLVIFGVAWPLLQAAGYWLMLKSAKGRFAHPLVTTQIALHWLVMFLLVGLVSRYL